MSGRTLNSFRASGVSSVIGLSFLLTYLGGCPVEQQHQVGQAAHMADGCGGVEGGGRQVDAHLRRVSAHGLRTARGR